MRILIVDDERPARARLRRMLAQEAGIEAVEEAADGIEALQLAAAFAPDALLLDIEWLETADTYVALHTANGAPLLRQTLAALLERLGPGFVRCHRRAAVRLACIERIVALDKGDCEIVLRSGASVPCSRQWASQTPAMNCRNIMLAPR